MLATRPLSFYETLTAAIDDIAKYGFDSQQRVENWQRLIKEAAERSGRGQAQMEQDLRAALGAVYRKMVERNGVLRFHPGVERFTVERVKPTLRAELDRRILVSADLIRLNRRATVEKTLQRFSGWASSVPAGGSDVVSRGKVKEEVRQGLVGLRFEERRVLVDQGHKLTASINEIVASASNAIAATWHSHWRQANYDYREDHKERDNLTYAIRGSWALERGLINKGDGYIDEITRPGEEVFCRCWYTYVYSLRDLPSSMLTAKGRVALDDTRMKVRADSADGDLLAEAEALDRPGYARGLKRVRAVPDRDQWHAEYDPDTQEIVVQAKFFRELPQERLHVLLHEIGHRGQDVDEAAYEDFKRRHLNSLPAFLSMANPVHLRDFERRGHVDSVAAEAFAESYARAMLGMQMPSALAEFWEEMVMA